jgi:hypothetical protein
MGCRAQFGSTLHHHFLVHRRPVTSIKTLQMGAKTPDDVEQMTDGRVPADEAKWFMYK